MPRNDLPEFLDRWPARQNAVLEGDDVPVDDTVSDEEAQAVIRDALGGGLHGSRAQVVLARFKRERWRIIKEG